MSLNLTTFAAALKQHYADWKVENLVYKDNPFYAMVQKYEKFGGENLKLPLIYGNPQGRSAAFTNALANQTNSQLKGFLLTRNQDYSIASISNEVIMASQGDANAFLRAATVEIDGALHSLARSAAVSLYRSGSGSIGRVVSTQSGSSTTITLAAPDDITNFEVGMALVNDTVDGGGTPSSTPYYVVAVDRDSGTLQVSAAIGGSAATATVSGLTANKYIFVQGDYDSKMKGLSAWLPSSVSGSDSFFGVNRSADKTRLAGIYQDGTSKPIEEALIDLAVRIAREGGAPDHCFMNYTDFANLEKALGTKVQYVDVKAGYEGAFNFRGIVLNGPKGVIKVIPDQNSIPGEAFMLQLDTWKLASLGKVPTLFNTDGLQMLREASADALQIRCFYYAQLGCVAPGYNGRVKLRNV